MKKAVKLTGAFLLFCFAANAQIVEKVYTSDGSIYEGYISEQIPGKSISVYAEIATLKFNKDSLKSVQENVRRISIFGETAKAWIKKHADTNSIVLSSFEYCGSHYDNLKILDRGQSEITAVCLTPKTYRVNWADVTRTEKITKEGSTYRFMDIITLINGRRIEGFITEQIIGKSIKIKTPEGTVYSVNNGDILSIGIEAIEKNTHPLQQALLLDKLTLYNGSECQGCITSRVMQRVGSENDKSIYIKTNSSEEEFPVKMSDISKYSKIPNPEYVEYIPVEVDTTMRITVNGTETTIAETIRDDKYYYGIDTSIVRVNARANVCIQLENIDCKEIASIFKTVVRKYKLKGDIEYYGKNYPSFCEQEDEELLYQIKKISDSKYAVELIFKDKGVYFIQFGKDFQGIFIEVK